MIQGLAKEHKSTVLVKIIIFSFFSYFPPQSRSSAPIGSLSPRFSSSFPFPVPSFFFFYSSRAAGSKVARSSRKPGWLGLIRCISSKTRCGCVVTETRLIGSACDLGRETGIASPQVTPARAIKKKKRKK